MTKIPRANFSYAKKKEMKEIIPQMTPTEIASLVDERVYFDEWDGAGNSKILGLRESHPLTPAGLEHDAEYWKGEKPRYKVTGRFLYKGWLDTLSTVWDAASAVTVMTAATVIVPIWDMFRYKQKPKDETE